MAKKKQISKNRFGVSDKDLCIRISSFYLNAEQFIKAMRELQKKAKFVEFGLDEFSQTDRFTLQMAGQIRDWCVGGGTHNTLPDDINEILFKNYDNVREKA